MQITKKALEKVQLIKGVKEAFILNETDRNIIVQLEKKDDHMIPRGFGIKQNIGVDQALKADILISFLTDKEYDWPKNNLKIVHRGNIIGEDISNIDELNRLKESNNCCICGNIVLYKEKIKYFKDSDAPPVMLINSKPCPEIEEIPFVSEAMIASPSRSTHNYLYSKMSIKNTNCIGSFLLGLNLEETFA